MNNNQSFLSSPHKYPSSNNVSHDFSDAATSFNMLVSLKKNSLQTNIPKNYRSRFESVLCIIQKH